MMKPGATAAFQRLMDNHRARIEQLVAARRFAGLSFAAPIPPASTSPVGQ